MEIPQDPSNKSNNPANGHSEPTPVTSSSPSQSSAAPEQSTAISSSNGSGSEVVPPSNGLNDPKTDKVEPSPAPSKSTVLQQQIHALESLRTRMAKIRGMPAHLIILQAQSPLISFGGFSGLGLGDGNGTSDADAINSLLNADAGTEGTSQARRLALQAQVAFRTLNDARDELVKASTQGALKTAQSSEIQDKSEIALNGRRTRKKRRIATADSPAPFPSFHVETEHVFPPTRPQDKEINDRNDLVQFIREYNGRKSEASRTKLAIWMPSRPKSGTPHLVSDPLTVRVAIRDVITVFVKLRRPDRDSGTRQLFVDSVVAFGPREKKSPYSHSDFTVYQKLTQHVARLIEKEPCVSFVQVLDLLTSYEDLFITQCSVCHRILPLEGHVPPVGRVWKESSITTEGERGRWEARHISCLHA